MLGPLQRATHTIPIVFVQVADAVGGGFVKSLAKPGGNATGFTNFEFDISTKWLELLKQIAPRMVCQKKLLFECWHIACARY